MRTIAFTLLIVCQYVAIQAQGPVLLRTLLNGGRYGNGTITELSVSDQTFADVYDFKILNAGGKPDATQLIEWGGMLWGMTYEGGTNNHGVLFSYDTLTHEYTVMHNFAYTTGAYPRGSLLAASNGLMYGLTTQGGMHGDGVLFEYSPLSNAYEVKIHFTEPTGDGPFGSLVEASNGLLYGTTYGGGIYELGTLFSYNPATTEMTFLHNFSGLATNPTGTLCYASNGKLYGLTIHGGSLDSGALYEYDLTTNGFTLIHGFTHEEFPYGSVIEADDQKLYGMTRYGGTINYGYIFSYKPASGVFSQLYSFNKVNGGIPYGDLYQASNGLLYGLTLVGGSSMQGVLFEFNPANAGYIEKHAFNQSEGYFPHGTPMQATNGRLYGLTNSGGYPGLGGLFEYDLTNDSLVFNLYFNESEGKNPYGNLLYVSDNKLIGTINIGGKYNKGAVYLYNHATNSIESTASFDGSNGANPIGPLLKVQNGKFYGMTSKGGTNNFGVIFEYTLENAKIIKIVDFEGWNGRQPMGSLSQHENGNLFAMTYSGGKDGTGTLIEFDPTSMTCDSVFSFTMPKGMFPKGSLCNGPDGEFYGLTSAGGSGGSGVLFRYNPVTNKYHLITNLNYTTGYSPVGTPFLAGNGKIYSTTTIGGLFGKGTVVEYNPANAELQVIHSFDGVNGSNCKSDLMQASDGLLYGTTAYGGENNGGVLFSLNTDTEQFTKLADFTDTCGHNPMYGALVEVPFNVGIAENRPFNDKTFAVCPNPVVDEFISLTGLNKANQVNVFDMLGRKVYSHKTTSTYHQIPVEGLMNGLYLIKVEDNRNSIQTKKILVKRNR